MGTPPELDPQERRGATPLDLIEDLNRRVERLGVRQRKLRRTVEDLEVTVRRVRELVTAIAERMRNA